MIKTRGFIELRHNFLRRESMQPSAFGNCAARLLLWLFVLSVFCSATRAGKPNVLFIAIDDLKPALGCYGDAKAITPNIDRLAARATVFTNAHCQWPVCGPSRASLMTSLRPEANGVTNLKTSMRAKDAEVLTLPQHFRNNGYATAGAGKIYDPRCVDDRKTADAASWSIPFMLPKSPAKQNGDKRFADSPDVEDSELIDGAIADDGLKLLRRLSQSDKPFFLAVGFKKPHLPFVAPRKYWDLYKRDQFRLASHSGGIVDATGYTIHDSTEFRGYDGVPKSGEFSKQLQLEAIHGYYACTSYIDTQVGRLIDELNSSGLAENTTIVLWGDHGFHLGDHGMWGKHSTLEQATRVPLLICPPKKNDSGSATQTTMKKTSAPVEFTDIFPTLCQLSGLEIPSQIAGRSLFPLMDGTSPRVRGGALTVFKSKGSIGYSYRTQRYRYTEWISNKSNKIAATELYDYENDPLETKNVVEDPDYADVPIRLAKQMRAEGLGCERLLKTGPNTVSINVHNPTEEESPTLKPEKAVSSPPKLPVPDGARFREIAPSDGSFPLLVGGTISTPLLGTTAETILNREFQFVTPANAFKQTAVHPEPGKWNWKKADMWVDRCEKRGDLMRLHACVSPQCSAWAEEDDRTPEELLKNMEQYVRGVCKRYADRKHVRWIDVVNETITREGEWFGPKPGVGKWQNPWPQIGVDETHPLRPPLYIKRAFQIADRHAPNIKLLYNQHGGMELAAWAKVRETVMYLKDKNVRIDGIGWQGHIDSGFEKDSANMKQLNELISWAHANDLEFHVTENTVWVREGGSAEYLKAQAETFRAIVETLLQHSDEGVVSWNAWQMRDTDPKRGDFLGTLFDKNGAPKPAYYAVQSALMKYSDQHRDTKTNHDN